MRATTCALRAVGAIALATSLSLVLGTPAYADVYTPPPATVGTSGPTITVTVSGSGYRSGLSGTGGGNNGPAVHPPCWRHPVETGTEYYNYVASGAEALYDQQNGLPYEPRSGYQAHKDDDLGHWYSRTCDSSNPNDRTAWATYLDQLWAGPYFVYYTATQSPALPPVPPEVLRDIAIESLTLPKPELDWNPKIKGNDGTLVNLDTWFWLNNAPRSLQVTAAAGTSSATVTAAFAGMDITAPGERTETCPGSGTRYVTGAQTTDCALVFSQASVGLGSLSEQASGVEKTPVKVTASWTGTWEANGQPMGAITLQSQPSATVPIRVDEVQTLVTSTG